MKLSDRHLSRSIPITTLFRPLRFPSYKGQSNPSPNGIVLRCRKDRGLATRFFDVDPAIGLDRSLLAVRISRRRGLLVPGLFWLRHLLVLRWQRLGRGLRRLQLRPSDQITTCVYVFRGLWGALLRHRPRWAQEKSKHEKYRRSIHHQFRKTKPLKRI